jgi:effector-binding domain-containing protein
LIQQAQPPDTALRCKFLRSIERFVHSIEGEIMVKTTEPKLDNRSEQHYAGIRTQITMEEMSGDLIPQMIDEVMGWLGKKGVEADGAAFMRYYVINMPGKLDIEIGVPVAKPVTGDDRVKAGVLPAGRYASLVYTDVTKGMEGNSVLIGWAEKNGIQWDRWDDPNGDAFRSRYEIFIDGPEEDPDPTNWRTEVAIKLADGQAA